MPHLKGLTTEEAVMQMVADYKNGMAGPAIARKYDIPHCNFYIIAKRLGLKTNRNNGEHRRFFNENAFAGIDGSGANEEAEYWIGFLMADGSVTQGKYFNLAIGEADASHIEEYRKFLKSEHKITKSTSGNIWNEKKSNRVQLSIYSKKVVADLATYGIGPRKSMTAEVIGDIKNSRHFWRGVVDGDGHLGFSKGSPNIGLVGSKRTVEQFCEYVQKAIGGKLPSTYKMHMIWRMQLCATRGWLLIRHLYDGATVALDRKAKLAAKSLDWRCQHVDGQAMQDAGKTLEDWREYKCPH